MRRFAKPGKHGLLLEAEVARRGQTRFETRYKAATGVAVSAGKSRHYQDQPNKWGAELRVYFNDPGMAASLAVLGFHVEHPRKGYMAGKYDYRVNDAGLWWKLVEDQGFRLGAN
ncbi:MAG TPA: hypothetical protein VFQ00_00520 [Terriglobales bacterium]|nr:hypothetical protein [Terriglobales bacterium]